MKTLCAAVLFGTILFAQETDKASDPACRNMVPSSSIPFSITTRDGGLSPTTWGLSSMYSGTRYGTGYYAFDIDRTLDYTNGMAAITFSYTFHTNDLRAIYTFDISSLAGLPGPIWSSFMFNTRERPSPDTMGMFGISAINLESDGHTHTLVGRQFNSLNNAEHLDIYDAEEFENDDPFAHPELAFSGANPYLTTVLVSEGDVIYFDVDVTDTISADLPPTIPTLGEAGRVSLLLLLGLAGFFFIRRS